MFAEGQHIFLAPSVKVGMTEGWGGGGGLGQIDRKMATNLCLNLIPHEPVPAKRQCANAHHVPGTTADLDLGYLRAVSIMYFLSPTGPRLRKE